MKLITFSLDNSLCNAKIQGNIFDYFDPLSKGFRVFREITFRASANQVIRRIPSTTRQWNYMIYMIFLPKHFVAIITMVFLGLKLFLNIISGMSATVVEFAGTTIMNSCFNIFRMFFVPSINCFFYPIWKFFPINSTVQSGIILVFYFIGRIYVPFSKILIYMFCIFPFPIALIIQNCIMILRFPKIRSLSHTLYTRRLQVIFPSFVEVKKISCGRIFHTTFCAFLNWDDRIRHALAPFQRERQWALVAPRLLFILAQGVYK